jgi:hypothetical protein
MNNEEEINAKFDSGWKVEFRFSQLISSDPFEIPPSSNVNPSPIYFIGMI